MLAPLLLRLILPALATLWAVVAEAREIEWRRVDIAARIDTDGALHVSERHQMVFTGDWSGAERRFRVGATQWMRLESLTRIEPDEAEVRLFEGKLELFDRYQWSPEEKLLRWRIRQPSDAIFDRAELVYRIGYVLSGALQLEEDGSYALAHDFSFERPSVIEHLRVRLVLDEGWSTSWPSPIELERDQLKPGESAVLELSLQHEGPEPPALVHRPRPPAPPEPSLLSRLWGDGRLWASAVFLALLAALLEALFARGRQLGHYAPLPKQAEIDRGWLEKHILTLQPEVVGAAYDRHTGSAEVAALLARLEQEGKVKSAVTKHGGDAGPEQLELELRVPREDFDGYERVLIDRLFIAGERTNTALICQHYQVFNPASALAQPLAGKLRGLLGPFDEGLSPFAVALAVVAVVALRWSISRIASGSIGYSGLLDLALWVGLILIAVLGGFMASVFRQQPQARDGDPSLRGGFAAIGLMVVAPVLWPRSMAPLELVLHFGGGLCLAGFFIWIAWPRDHAAGIALRKHLLAARLYFEAQLQKERPDLDDRWYPYVVALGLSPEVDAWFSAFDTRRPRRKEESSSDSSALFESETSLRSERAEPAEPSPWKGGGGSFGGAGASGAWASAALDLASSIARAASSTSGGTSGPSLSSESKPRSGGGSAGGW